MPTPDETVRLRLERHGDEWNVAEALRGPTERRVAERDDELVTAALVDPDATSPGEVLEAVGRVLDRRETERITAAVAAGTDERTPIERLADEQRAAAQDDPRGEADR